MSSADTSVYPTAVGAERLLHPCAPCSHVAKPSVDTSFLRRASAVRRPHRGGRTTTSRQSSGSPTSSPSRARMPGARARTCVAHGGWSTATSSVPLSRRTGRTWRATVGPTISSHRENTVPSAAADSGRRPVPAGPGPVRSPGVVADAPPVGGGASPATTSSNASRTAVGPWAAPRRARRRSPLRFTPAVPRSGRPRSSRPRSQRGASSPS